MVNQKLFNGVYHGKRVLVTGHTGFKGSWLTLWLSQLGAEVLGVSKYLPSQPNHFEVIQLEKKIKHVSGDICQYDSLKKIFDDFKPEMVFHLAAQPIVMTAYDNPRLTFETNLGGTVNVLECIRQTTSVKAVVVITSDKCYENVGWDWGYRETDILGGADPYSASKACAEIAFSAYVRSFFNKPGMPVMATVRAGNVIGGGDWAANRIVPDCIRAWSEKREVEIRKPEATRPWLFVLEPLSGYLWVGACLLDNPKGLHGEAFNFGPDTEVINPVRDLVEQLAQYWDKANFKYGVASENHEATLLKLSYDKILRRANWKPILSFKQTVAMTAEWYKAYYDGKLVMNDISLKQIETYTKIAIEKRLPWAGVE